MVSAGDLGSLEGVTDIDSKPGFRAPESTKGIFVARRDSKTLFMDG